MVANHVFYTTCTRISLVPRLLWNVNMCTRGEAGIFSMTIKIGPEFLEQKDSVVQLTMYSMLGVYDTHPLITREV